MPGRLAASLVSTVIGFPHGGTTTETKVAETQLACEQGRREVDMVANLGKALSGDWDYVAADIRAVVDAARSHGAITKVIFETGLLPNDDVKIRLCQVSEAAGAAFVKTSTGFGFVKGRGRRCSLTGATEHDVQVDARHLRPGRRKSKPPAASAATPTPAASSTSAPRASAPAAPRNRRRRTGEQARARQLLDRKHFTTEDRGHR